MSRPYRFRVLVDFEAEVNGYLNVYHAGHAYTVRVGPAWDHLDTLVSQWMAEGRVAVE